MRATTPPHHVFKEAKSHDDRKWECVHCGLASEKDIPPCVYCGAEDGDKCRLCICELKVQDNVNT